MPIRNKKSKLFEMTNINEKEGEIKVYGEITKWAWEEFGETNALIFNEQLKNFKDVEKITLRINSPGGSVFEAQTMYNSLKQFAKDNKIEVVTFIEGIAASAATFLALAGETIKMGEGCLFMIHNPSSYASGMSGELRKVADLLDKVKETILDIYLKKSTLTREELSQKMDDETWFSATEAKEAGFIDEIEKFENVANKIGEVINSSCVKEFKHLEKITNLASEVKNKKERSEVMPKTLNDLKNTHSELLAEYEKEVLQKAEQSEYIQNMITAAIETERKRIEELSNIKTFNKKQDEQVKNAMFKNPREPKDLIVDFYQSEAFKAQEELNNLDEEKKGAGLKDIKDVVPPLDNKDEELSTDIENAALEAFKEK